MPTVSDLNHNAELLEQSTKRNDKYTVRRILDAHFSYFRMKKSGVGVQPPQLPPHLPPAVAVDPSSTSTTPAAVPAPPPATTPRRKYVSVPATFLNILHLAIESNAIDVLRICLKYGCDPNEPGTNLKRALLNLDTNKYESSMPMAAAAAAKAKQQTARYPVKCNYCLRKNAKMASEKSNEPTSGPSRVYALHKQMHQMFLEAEAAKSDKKDTLVSDIYYGVGGWLALNGWLLIARYDLTFRLLFFTLLS